MIELAYIRKPGPPGVILAEVGPSYRGERSVEDDLLTTPVAQTTFSLDGDDVVVSQLKVDTGISGQWGRVALVTRLHAPALLASMCDGWTGRRRFAKPTVGALHYLCVVDCPPTPDRYACALRFLGMGQVVNPNAAIEMNVAETAQLVGSLADALQVTLNAAEIPG